MKHNMLTLSVVGSAAWFIGCSAPAVGLTDTGLHPCPDSPNCVTSQGGDRKHGVAPIAYQTGRSEAYAMIRQIVSQEKGATIIAETQNYLHAAFRTKIMKFVDDVEFWFPADQAVIHVRSASRLGYSDLGANRKRVERIRTLFANTAAPR
jgi:uncharacterized protein (DUF1499 family)